MSQRQQDKVGVITVAVADMIATIYIGAHSGQTPEVSIAPSLRETIDSRNIAKFGVNIFTADFIRHKEYFGLKPHEAIGLSHLHSIP